MKGSIALFFLIVTIRLFSQSYQVSEIPSEIRRGADAVVRISEQSYEILDISSALYKEKKAITIFNSEAFHFAVFNEGYDKLSKLNAIKVSYYNKDGEQIKKVRSGDIEDYKMTSSISIYDDNRIKYFQPEEFDYPFTIEYSFSKELNGIFMIPPFYPIYSVDQGVEKAQYKIITPKGYKIRYKGFDGMEEPIIQASEKNSYSWRIENLAPRKREYRGRAVWDLSPRVMFGLSIFSMEGYSGNMSTWSGLGEWIAQLNSGRDEISEEVKAKVDDLIAGVNDPREKARRIYKFMQENTRYVSIQLGIGGFQPFEAQEVIRTGYGDCKALSNYMYSLLKYAGINSNYVVIRAGSNEEDIVTDFPSSQFNHAILAVPMEKDTVWLECTSQVIPFNFLGDFTDNRHGLLITKEGVGKLVKTPSYAAEQSTQNRTIELAIDSEGNAKANVTTVSRGVQYNQQFRRASESSEEQRKRLLNTIDLPAFDLGSFSYHEDRSTEDPTITEKIELSLRKYASVTGKRLFVTPNLLNKYNAKPPKNEKRESPIRIRYSFVDTDTVKIKIPEGYRMEFEMEPYIERSEFGEYSLNYYFDPDTNVLTYIRRFKLNAGYYPAKSYDDYRSFVRKVVRQDKSKVILVGAT